MANSISLGVNIDPIATLRQARGARYPDPVMAALTAATAGADHITLHLREDKRHIQDRDLILLKGLAQTPINLEMAPSESMLALAEQLQPEYVCLVPEIKEGGLDMVEYFSDIKNAYHRLVDQGIHACLSVEPDCKQIELAKEAGAHSIEIYAGQYGNALRLEEQKFELSKIEKAVKFAHALGLQVHVGHGLHYHNVTAIACIPEIRVFNIGHAIISQAIFTGLDRAVKEMKTLIKEARL